MSTILFPALVPGQGLGKIQAPSQPGCLRPAFTGQRLGRSFADHLAVALGVGCRLFLFHRARLF
jgi:hypothetical protein